jgi:hypothetical protein
MVFSFLLIEFHQKVEKRFPPPEGAKGRGHKKGAAVLPFCCAAVKNSKDRGNTDA